MVSTDKSPCRIHEKIYEYDECNLVSMYQRPDHHSFKSNGVGRFWWSQHTHLGKNFDHLECHKLKHTARLVQRRCSTDCAHSSCRQDNPFTLTDKIWTIYPSIWQYQKSCWRLIQSSVPTEPLPEIKILFTLISCIVRKFNQSSTITRCQLGCHPSLTREVPCIACASIQKGTMYVS